MKRLLSMAILELCLAANVKAQPLTMADPTILHTHDTYYLYGTSAAADHGFEVYTSKDLTRWTGPAGNLNGCVLTKDTSWGTQGFWAPQVIEQDGKYIMIYTANEQIAVARADSPLGPFTQATKAMIPAKTKEIDPFVFFDTDGKAYLYHVRLINGNRIYVAELNTNLNSMKEETARECISATLPWEDTAHAQWTVTEGPTVVKMGNTYYMFYSANDFRNRDYAVGVATATNPMGPWKKADKPLISRHTLPGVYGTGHGDLFKDAKGHMWYVFHTHYSKEKVSPRKTAIVRVTFNKGQFSIMPKTFKFLEK